MKFKSFKSSNILRKPEKYDKISQLIRVLVRKHDFCDLRDTTKLTHLHQLFCCNHSSPNKSLLYNAYKFSFHQMFVVFSENMNFKDPIKMQITYLFLDNIWQNLPLCITTSRSRASLWLSSSISGSLLVWKPLIKSAFWEKNAIFPYTFTVLFAQMAADPVAKFCGFKLEAALITIPQSLYIRLDRKLTYSACCLLCSNWFKLVYGPFGQTNIMHRTLDVCPDQSGRNWIYQS